MRWLALILLADAVPGVAPAEIFHLISAQSEIYSLLALDCVPPIELRRASPPLFTVFADSALSFFEGCVPNSTVLTDVMQRTVILADSIYFHERVWTSLGMEGARSAVSKSEGSIRFRVPEGRQLHCSLGGALWVANPGGAKGAASSWLALSRVGPEGTTVLYEGSAQAPPGPPTEGYFTASFNRALEPGDYLYEAHLSAQALYPSGNPMGELWLRLKFRDVTTHVDRRSTWGALKILYR